MNKRLWLTGFAGLLAAAPAAWAQEKPKETVTTHETKTEVTREEKLPDYTVGSREAAADLLRQRVASVNWKDATFEEVLDWVKTQGEGRVNVVPKWGALSIESVKNDSTVNLQLNTTTIADVLNEVLDQLSETGDLEYRAIGNKLTISTKQDFGRTMYVRVYDVGDLLFRVENFGQEAPKIDLQKTNRSSGSGGGGQSVFSGGSGSGGQQNQDTERLERENEERLIKLRHLIEQTIAPETWDLSGGEGGGTQTQATGGGGRGRIRVLNTSLIVLNTIEVHEMIAGAFNFGG
jgi:hypothetical protein